MELVEERRSKEGSKESFIFFSVFCLFVLVSGKIDAKITSYGAVLMRAGNSERDGCGVL